MPRRPLGAGGGEHVVTGPGVVVPPAVRHEVHVGQLPDLARVVDAALQPLGLLGLAHFEPVLEEQDPRVGHRLLDPGRHAEESLDLLVAAEAHHPLDARPVVPAAVEDHDLTARWQVRHVTLKVHLRFLALGRTGQSDHAEHAWTHASGDRLDRAALAGAVATLEHDADLGSRRLDPFLHGDQLGLQRAELGLVLLALHFRLFTHFSPSSLACGQLTNIRETLGGVAPTASPCLTGCDQRSCGARFSLRRWMALSIAVNAGATSESPMTTSH